MIKAIIFDLDFCLSASDEVGRELFASAFDAIRKANRGTISEDTLERAFEDSWRIAFDAIATTYGFSGEMREAGWKVFSQITVTQPMYGYGDLDVLKDLAVMKFLVTSGFRRLQESKIQMLGISSLLTDAYVDAIDEPGRIGKRGFFENILADHALQPAEVLVVGDNPESEIEAGNQLGMTTVQILRPGVTRDARAMRHIQSLRELKAMI
jgi:putative hydrolase of the HAD superfamily